MSDFEEAGDGDVMRKIKGDFEGAGLDMSDSAIRSRMDELLIEAAREIEAGR